MRAQRRLRRIGSPSLALSLFDLGTSHAKRQTTLAWAKRSRTKQVWRAPYFLKVYRLRGSTLALEDQFSDTLEHEPEVNGSREMLH